MFLCILTLGDTLYEIIRIKVVFCFVRFCLKWGYRKTFLTKKSVFPSCFWLLTFFNNGKDPTFLFSSFIFIVRVLSIWVLPRCSTSLCRWRPLHCKFCPLSLFWVGKEGGILQHGHWGWPTGDRFRSFIC